jgi:hypothetical protein
MARTIREDNSKPNLRMGWKKGLLINRKNLQEGNRKSIPNLRKLKTGLCREKEINLEWQRNT